MSLDLSWPSDFRFDAAERTCAELKCWLCYHFYCRCCLNQLTTSDNWLSPSVHKRPEEPFSKLHATSASACSIACSRCVSYCSASASRILLRCKTCENSATWSKSGLVSATDMRKGGSFSPLSVFGYRRAAFLGGGIELSAGESLDWVEAFDEDRLDSARNRICCR